MTPAGGSAGPGEHENGPPPGGMFRLRVLPASWMRGLLGTVTALATIVIALGDLASAWVLLVAPLTVAAVVAYNEFLERLLNQPGDRRPDRA